MSHWCVGLLTVVAATWLTAPQPIEPDPVTGIAAPAFHVVGVSEPPARAVETGDNAAGHAAPGVPQTGVEIPAAPPRGVDPSNDGPPRREDRVEWRQPTEPTADLPKVWIGVRVTPVPAPLAAHIGRGGAMVANVVKDSPADAAGLEQYDVIVKFAGRDIVAPQDLPRAVAASAAGRAADVEVLRRGTVRELKITPAERPSGPPGELKYPEPEEGALVEEALRLRGLTARPGPGGEWLLEDLGPLRELPDVLRELSRKFELGLDLPTLPRFDEDADDEPSRDAAVELRIAARWDGRRIEITRDANGVFTVTREDPEGERKEARYESEEALAEGDPSAYELYRKHAVSERPFFTRRRPDPRDAQRWRGEFQLEVEKRLREALERGAAARERAKAEIDRAAEALREYRRYFRSGGDGITVLVARVDPDGAITIREKCGPRETKYRFDSVEDLKAAEPELYERLRELLPQ